MIIPTDKNVKESNWFLKLAIAMVSKAKIPIVSVITNFLRYLPPKKLERIPYENRGTENAILIHENVCSSMSSSWSGSSGGEGGGGEGGSGWGGSGVGVGGEGGAGGGGGG